MFENLKSINEQKALTQAEANKHTETQLANIELQKTVVKSVKALADHQDNQTIKAIIVNQLREIGTPDALKVAEAVNDMHETLKTRENTDLTDTNEFLSQAVELLKSIPKELPEAPEQKFIDYSEVLSSLLTGIEDVKEAVKAQETTVEAPVVTYEAPDITVEAPDLKPLTKEIKDSFDKSVSKIKIPEVKPTDIKPITDEQKKQTKILKGILEKPVGGGGGGGGSSWVAVNDAGTPVPIQLDNGAVPITGTITAEASTLAEFQFNDSDATTTALTEYFGYTKPDGTWLVKKLTDTTLRYATVTNNGAVTTYASAWAAIASLTYGRMDEVF